LNDSSTPPPKKRQNKNLSEYSAFVKMAGMAEVIKHREDKGNTVQEELWILDRKQWQEKNRKKGLAG
jgi:general stress protein 26